MTNDDGLSRGFRQEPHVQAGWHRPWLGGPLVLAVGALILVGVLALPRENAALPVIARHAMEIAVPVWGQAEVVSEIVYGSRGFDTFGETFLLLGAVAVVLTLSRPREPRSEYVGEASEGRAEQRRLDPDEPESGDERKARQAESGEESETRRIRMSVVVRVAVRTAVPLLAVASVYTAAWGYTPGGGFPAGAAAAGVVLLVYAALGHRAVRHVVRSAVVEPIELAGATVIVALGVAGIVIHGSMFANVLPLAQPLTILAGGNAQLYSGAELVEVATGLIIAIFSLLGMGRDWTIHDDDSQQVPAPQDEDQ